MDKNQLKAQALKERISELVSNYEEVIAEFRADATIQLSELSKKNDNLQLQVESLREQLQKVVEKGSNNVDLEATATTSA